MSRLRASGRDGAGPSTRLGLADRLALAATPSFAVMALLTALFASGPEPLCPATAGGFPLGGMVPMYGLMCLFHLGPWLRWAAVRWPKGG